MKEILHKAKFVIYFTIPSNLLLDDSAGRIARELWWTNQEFSPVDKFIPWFSMLIYIYLLVGEKQARWWPQFRDVVSPHRHDHHHDLNLRGDIH
jgi:hypothetical protein